MMSCVSGLWTRWAILFLACAFLERGRGERKKEVSSEMPWKEKGKGKEKTGDATTFTGIVHSGLHRRPSAFQRPPCLSKRSVSELGWKRGGGESEREIGRQRERERARWGKEREKEREREREQQTVVPPECLLTHSIVNTFFLTEVKYWRRWSTFTRGYVCVYVCVWGREGGTER